MLLDRREVIPFFKAAITGHREESSGPEKGDTAQSAREVI